MTRGQRGQDGVRSVDVNQTYRHGADSIDVNRTYRNERTAHAVQDNRPIRVNAERSHNLLEQATHASSLPPSRRYNGPR
jgi:hypothetical protein